MMSSGAAPISLPSAALSRPGHFKKIFIPKEMWSGLLFKRGSCRFNRDSRKGPLVCGIQPNAAIEWTEVLGIQIIRIHESHVLTTQNH